MLSLNNFILRTDSYKLTHWKALPKDLKYVKSYLEARGGGDATVFFGLQYYCKEYLDKVTITYKDVLEAEQFASFHFETPGFFNKEGWLHIVNNCGGKLPIKIKAVKEGTLVPISNVLMTIENTDEKCPWLTNVVETLLMKLWYPITIATNSMLRGVDIGVALKQSGSDYMGLIWKLHDFAYRGVTCEEQAGIGGMSHLLTFNGTDTIRGIQFADNYYNSGVCGFSVAASEHFVACCYGSEKEEEYFAAMVNSYEGFTTSMVSDTYHVYKFIRKTGTNNKELILARTNPIVYRPDSGKPVDVCCGYGFEEDGKYYTINKFGAKVEITRDQHIGLIGILWEVFGDHGTTKNGFKLLPPQVRLIQGDGIDKHVIVEILVALMKKGYSVDNLVFGSGGGLLQKFDRDTYQFAIKASFGIFGKLETTKEDYTIDLVKDPFTSKGKKSKGGDMKLTEWNDTFKTVTSKDLSKFDFDSYIDVLEEVHVNGETVRYQSFDEIKSILNKHFTNLIETTPCYEL